MPRDFKDDDGPTMPEARYRGAPEKPLDVSSEALPVNPLKSGAVTVQVRPPKPAGQVARPVRAEGVDEDALWDIYDAAVRAWGKMTIAGAPRDSEHAIVNGCTQLREYLQSLDVPHSEDDHRRIAMQAMKLKTAVDHYEVWLAGRPR
jgi:hypothetical protein